LAPELITRVDLVRHAHADWQPDEARPLSARGQIGAAAVTECLRRKPITAVYSSPARRALQTVEGLGIAPIVLADLRERELAPVFNADFHGTIRAAWSNPDVAPPAGESNVTAQARGLEVLRTILGRHPGQHLVVATHGNLLALILNALDSSYGYEFWCAMTFPDIYELQFEGDVLTKVDRIYDEAREHAPGT
jgi:2,3-bisphosphoglycerate-dependent phosphoglycerate mutase